MQRTENNSAKRIICIEDDKDTCDMLSFLFSEYDFSFVHTSREALPLIEQGDYDLYILDNWLPGVSGVELCKKIRSLNENVPIVFTSALTRKADIQEALNAGASEYLAKPYEPEELQKIVKELINNKSP